MVTAVCKCYKCNYEFNYEYIPGSSFHSIRLGYKRIFRCPKCHTLQKFDLREKGPKESLKTYGDSADLGVGAKLFAILLVPTILLSFFGGISFIFFVNPLYLHFVLIFSGVVWVVLALVYIIYKTGPK